jgi:hypothetical protein
VTIRKPPSHPEMVKEMKNQSYGTKLVQMTFTRETCPPVTLNGQKISQAEDAKYLVTFRSQTKLEETISIY